MRKVEVIKKRWRLFVVPLGAIFFTIISVFLFLIPRIKIIAKLNLQVKEGEKRLQRLTAKVADLEGLDAVALKERKEFSLKVVPSQKNVMEVVSLAYNLAQNTQVNLTSVEISPGEISTQSGLEAKAEVLEVLPFEIIAEGTRDKILDFISLLEKSIPLMSVSSFKITQAGQFVRGQLRVTSYLAPLPKSLGKTDTPLVKLTELDEEIFKKLDNLKTYEIPAAEGLPADFVSSPASFSARTNPFSF